MRLTDFSTVHLVIMIMATAGFGTVTPNRLFTNNMVLQHGAAIPVWGAAAAGETVTVQIGGQTKSTTAAADGSWKVTLDSLPVTAAPLQMTIKGSNALTLTNVLVGDVWLCSGQSNMQFGLLDFGYNPSVEAAGMTPVRLLTLTSKNGWSECSPSTAGGFSAVAFFFGKNLYDSLKIPIGLAVAAVGATCVEQWMTPKSVAADPDPTLASFRCSYCGGDTTGPVDPKNVSALYRMYIAPTVPFAIKGIAWYQGEWNTFVNNGVNHPEKFLTRFEELVTGWRSEWNRGDLPFYYVQLPNYFSTSMNWPLIREDQRLALKDLKKTGMAITIDIGDSATVHPTNKRDVGYRLALVALEKSYGHTKLVGSGPLFRNFYIVKDTAHLMFDYAGSGLVAKNSQLGGFEVASKDSDFTAATAVLRGNEVVVYKPGGKVANVRYAWASNPKPTLYNKENLPASPFRTYASDVVGVEGGTRPSSSHLCSPEKSGCGDAMKVFDLRGRFVASVNSSGKTPDEVRRGTNLPRGVYLIMSMSSGHPVLFEKGD
jgi:sialate O-acetylesterase